MNDPIMAIAVLEARDACKGEPDILERVKKAMRACADHWMVTNPLQQLNAAIAAAALESNDAEKDIILRSGKDMNTAIATIQALISGVPVDMEKMDRPDQDLIPIAEMWRVIARH